MLYTHRSLVLHSYGLCMADTFALSERDTVLQLVPMFHANGWGIPYAAVMVGSKIVFSGRIFSRRHRELIESERATFTAGVPTLWMGLYSFLENEKHDISSLRTIVCRRLRAAAPVRRMVREEIRNPFHAGLGHDGDHADRDRDRTEEPPRIAAGSSSASICWRGTGCRLPASTSESSMRRARSCRGTASTMGELQVRGPWVTCGYYNDPRGEERAAESFMDGWFRTGDVATIDAEGYIQIMDRTKDLVKSGGEWISSVDLENAIMAHPKVVEAAVIAVSSSQVAGASAGRGRAAAAVSRTDHERGDSRFPEGSRRQVVAAGRRRVHRRGAQDQRRQIQQARAARAVQGLFAMTWRKL